MAPDNAPASCPRCKTHFKLHTEGAGRYETYCPDCEYWPVVVVIE